MKLKGFPAEICKERGKKGVDNFTTPLKTNTGFATRLAWREPFCTARRV